jgi:hypothetical protein
MNAQGWNCTGQGGILSVVAGDRRHYRDNSDNAEYYEEPAQNIQKYFHFLLQLI